MSIHTDPLAWLAGQDCAFVLVRARSKQPLYRGWPDKPVSLATAIRHVHRGGNVGLLLGSFSRNVICLDIDHGFPLVCRLYPDLTLIRITRPNAPERGKLLLRLDTPDPLPASRKWEVAASATPAVELLTRRAQALLPPSLHPSGVRYEWLRLSDTLPRITPTDLASLREVLTADPVARYTHLPPGRGCTAWMPSPSVPISALRTKLYTRFPSALAVFQHFGRAGRLQPIGTNDIRLCGNGGLIVGNPATPFYWRWYCFRDAIGGDIPDAVGYCLLGSTWNRRHKAHWEALEHMLFTGAPIPAPSTTCTPIFSLA